MDTNETYSEDAANASRLKAAAPAAVADPEPDPKPERDGLPLRQRRVVLGIMVSGTTAACISQSMMIAALPAVMHEYGISASSGQLLTTAYIFVLGLISAMTGYLMNRFDSKKLFFASMTSFAIGCAAAIFAPNYPCLLAARLLQAGGAGICLPLVQLVALNIYLCLATVFSTFWLPGSDNLAKEPPMSQISAFPSIKALSILLLVPLNSTSLPWWTTLSIIAEASLSSPRIVPHLLNSMLVVNTTLRFS